VIERGSGCPPIGYTFCCCDYTTPAQPKAGDNAAAEPITARVSFVFRSRTNAGFLLRLSSRRDPMNGLRSGIPCFTGMDTGPADELRLRFTNQTSSYLSGVRRCNATQYRVRTILVSEKGGSMNQSSHDSFRLQLPVSDRKTIQSENGSWLIPVRLPSHRIAKRWDGRPPSL
jgi:hypothetical protein